jgi:hypothetical protein
MFQRVDLTADALAATTELTPRNSVIEKLTVAQLVQKLSSFYGTPRFITVIRRARH